MVANKNVPNAKKTFGPGRSFPGGDVKHDRLAISGASRSRNTGNISASTAASIQSRARADLKKKEGENSPADKKQDAELSKRTGMTGKKLEDSKEDKTADAKRVKKVDHVSLAAKHDAMADRHRAESDKHMSMAKVEALNNGTKPVMSEWGGIHVALPGTVKGKL